MNPTLQLKGKFENKPNPNKPGARNIPKGRRIDSKHLSELIEQLKSIAAYWQKDRTIGGILLSVYYIDVIAKSNRISSLFKKGKISSNDTIRGSRFEGNPQKHVFIHFISEEILYEAIRKLSICNSYISNKYNGCITHDIIDTINNNETVYECEDIKRSVFVNTLVDAYYVSKFDVDTKVKDAKEAVIISLYKTSISTRDLLDRIGIDMAETKMIDDQTLRVSPEDFAKLKMTVPYLISMQVVDMREIAKEDILGYCDFEPLSIPDPKNEPFVGVIDTLFDDSVYFSKWVTYKRMISDDIEVDSIDYEHGTAISSIIVDGPSFNKNLDDGCGRFRVKHFGVATHGRFSSFTIMRNIREIVKANPDIKVWNLSLGSALEINPNYMSPEAAILDELQSLYDVVFVVAGTNKGSRTKETMKIGAPADSLNSLVVNAVDFKNNPASYHRVGPVLSFFNKPDVSYYGGDKGEYITVCLPNGEGKKIGTSFAAPWISRKLAFLIYKMGFSREIAKALIVDSAAGWNRRDDTTHSIGFGVVPIRIEDIVNTPDDEIRFIMTGSTESYETYTYRLPVPYENDAHPYYARATLCYYPTCSRNQGVDYTDTEMDIHFGRIHLSKGKVSIKSLNNNTQGDSSGAGLYEGVARTLYRKWDNIKHISDQIKSRAIPKKKYEAGMWGLSIKTKERLKSKHDTPMPFGVVVTLKEMHGKNRINDFIQMCQLNGWIVNRIDIDNRIDIYNVAEEDIEFD